MDKLVGVSLLIYVSDDLLVTPDRPMVAGKVDIGLTPEHLQRLIDKTTPGQRVPDLGAAGGIDIVHVARHHFGATERFLGGQVKGELRRRFRATGVLENHLNPVDHQALPGLCNCYRRL